MQRGRAYPSQHHTLGWNALRDFLCLPLKISKLETPDGHRSTRRKEREDEGSSLLNTAGVACAFLVRFPAFLNQCLSVFTCGFKRVILGSNLGFSTPPFRRTFSAGSSLRAPVWI